MSSTERRRGPGGALTEWAVPGLIGLAVAAGVVLWAGLHAGYAIDGTEWPADVPDNPVALLLYAARGLLPFTPAALAGTALAALAAAVLLAGLAVLLLRRRKPNRHVDAAAPHMARGRELARLSRQHAVDLARQLGVQTDVPGVLLGHTIGFRQQLWADWESTEVDIWGPRTGKTTSRAIPTLLDAPGAAIATSNRRDLVDATRGPRSTVGRVWVFDPQQIVGEPPAFYWNPLSYVLSGPAGSEVKAQQLAGIFASSAAPPDSKADRFFDPKGQTLLGHLIHAAALDGLDMAAVYRWTNRETDTEPARILDKHGFRPSGDYVRGIIGSPDKQRGGIYATAELCITWMTNRSAADWVTPGGARPPFDPATFALSHDTLYLVSREGRGTLGPLTAALTAATCEAAEHLATMSPRGRLSVPMVAVLDEAANVCRWPDLPDLFSHYGGRGIYLLVILQSWRQGEDTWGQRGMSKLWSAATVRIYGGGDTEVHFLDELRRLVGQYRPQQTSATSSRQGRSVNYSEDRDDILDVSDLASLPRGRQLLIASGARPTLIATQRWDHGPHADAVRASIALHDPGHVDAVVAPVVNPEPDVLPAGDAWRTR